MISNITNYYHDELNNEWQDFIKNSNSNRKQYNNQSDIIEINKNNDNDKSEIPKIVCSDIKISTKTNIIFLNVPIDIYSLFWKINIQDYDKCCEGIIKKQIKVSCLDREEVNLINDKLLSENIYNVKILNNIDNPNGRAKFKNTQKITVGISNKDVLHNRPNKKSAFYNCIVMTLRIYYNNEYSELHIKLFNTGKIEIPGIKSTDAFNYSINLFIKILQSYCVDKIFYNKDNIETILINSHFYCNYNINRDILFNIIRYKYNINSYYDSCSYPGIQSVFYYNKSCNLDEDQLGYITNKKDSYIKISFMIFRTGSILIVGKCDEQMINCVYKFIKNILYTYSDVIYDDYTYIKKNTNKTIKKKNKRNIYLL